MANRFPLIVDTSDSNKIKELPSGDSLDLTGSGIANAASISTATLTAQTIAATTSLTVNGQSLATVAFSGSYTDLENVPTGFSGVYDDLSNKPFIPTRTRDLADVDTSEPAEGDILRYDQSSGMYIPQELVFPEADLSNYVLGDLGNVLTSGVTENKYLKYYSGAWRPSGITYTEVQNAPTSLSQFINDSGYIVNGDSVEFGSVTTANVTGDVTGSVFADDSTLLVDAVNGTIPGYISLATLKAEVAASIDFADFQSRIAAL